jgi:tetratricopeptide (TPR) repeat protein
MAIDQYRRTLQIEPSFAPAQGSLAVLLISKGRYAEGFSQYEKAVPAIGWEPEQIKAIGDAFRKSGYREAVQMVIRVRVERSQRQQYVSPYYTAIWYALIADNDNAFKWLNKAYEVQDDSLPELKIEPGLRSLRSDPRYAELLRRMGLPQ